MKLSVLVLESNMTNALRPIDGSMFGPAKPSSVLDERLQHRVEIGSFDLAFESLFWKWFSQNRSPVAGSNSPGQVVYHFSRTLVNLEWGVNSCRV